MAITRYLATLGVGVLLLAMPVAAESETAKYKTTRIATSLDGTIQVTIPDIATVPDAPVVELSRVLKHNPTVRKFRANWKASVLGSSHSGTALYDRQNKNIKVYGVSSHLTAGRTKIHTLYSDVTDKMLYKAG